MNAGNIRPEWIVAAAAALWGLFWIPLRAFEQQGLSPGWTTITQFVAPLICLLPFAVVRLLRHRPVGITQIGTGISVGAAFALYCESLLLTDVVRALILFYVMPAWGTLAEVVLMGRRCSWWRGLALVLSLSGLIIVLRLGHDFLATFNVGDAMALASGIVFTFGAMRVRQMPDISVFEQLFAFFIYGSVIAVGLAYLPLIDIGAAPDSARLIALAPWLLAMSVFFLIPVMAGIYWGSRHVDPGRLGLLLQLEAIVGIGSAALLAGETFGIREAVGATLVIGAGFIEVFANRQESST